MGIFLEELRKFTKTQTEIVVLTNSRTGCFPEKPEMLLRSSHGQRFLHNYFEVKEREDGKGIGIPVVWPKYKRECGGEMRE
jgi:hypothetical protein